MVTLIGSNNAGLETVKFYSLADNPASFRKSREAWGEFSNMTGGFPIVVNGIKFQSSEGLYQALKFPHAPEQQIKIAKASNGWWAKKVAYSKNFKPYEQWDEHRIDAMRVALAFKLAQNPELAQIIRDTGERDIIENSSRDAFWGANPVDGGFNGANVLGKLLMDLRCYLNDQNKMIWLAAVEFAVLSFRVQFLINGLNIDPSMLMPTDPEYLAR